MQKIISLFQRNYETDRKIRDEVVSGAEWVQSGEGVATRKLDGTACMVRDGILYKRYDAKHGKTPPPGFEPVQDAPDQLTGHWPGWLPVFPSDSGDRWHLEAYRSSIPLPDGTYELLGPKIQGNPEKDLVISHSLLKHGDIHIPDCPRTFDELKEWFIGKDIEGIVWHHPDGRMVKIKKKDFGLRRGD